MCNVELTKFVCDLINYSSSYSKDKRVINQSRMEISEYIFELISIIICKR